MAVKFGECNITFSPAVTARCTRRRNAEVSMDIHSGCQAASAPRPITVVIRGEKLGRVVGLLALNQKTDAELAALVRASPLADEVADKTDTEAAAWVRGNVIDELREMAEERDGEQEADGGSQA